MYDGKRSTAEKILYDALDKIKSKNNEDPLKIFNNAINNVNQILSVDLEGLVEQLIKFQLK